MGRQRADVYRLRRRERDLLDGRQRHWPLELGDGSFHRFWNWQNSNLGGHNVTRSSSAPVPCGWAAVVGRLLVDGTNWNNVTLSPGGYSFSPNM
jgi:hypothetical protein